MTEVHLEIKVVEETISEPNSFSNCLLYVWGVSPGVSILTGFLVTVSSHKWIKQTQLVKFLSQFVICDVPIKAR